MHGSDWLEAVVFLTIGIGAFAGVLTVAVEVARWVRRGRRLPVLLAGGLLAPVAIAAVAIWVGILIRYGSDWGRALDQLREAAGEAAQELDVTLTLIAAATLPLALLGSARIGLPTGTRVAPWPWIGQVALGVVAMAGAVALFAAQTPFPSLSGFAGLAATSVLLPLGLVSGLGLGRWIEARWLGWWERRWAD